MIVMLTPIRSLDTRSTFDREEVLVYILGTKSIQLTARHPKLPPKSVDDVMTAEINKWIRCARAA